jgi:hypothetical protein
LWVLWVEVKETLDTFKNPGIYAVAYDFTENDWNSLISEIASEQIDIKDIKLDEKKFLIKTAKSTIANMVWEKDGYYQVKAFEDQGVKKALELISK